MYIAQVCMYLYNTKIGQYNPFSYFYLHSELCNINLLNIIPFLLSRNAREWMFLVINLTPCYRIFLLYIMDLGIEIN
jgi:hypothetical protein